MEDEGFLIHMFEEPAGYFKADGQATYAEYTLLRGQTLRLRLVGHSPLWGHHLWNGSRAVATYLQHHAESLVQNKNVLEFGAGAGLPSLVAGMLGARKVVVTDYPDEELISNLKNNIESCKHFPNATSIISAQGYVWGQPSSLLLSHISSSSASQPVKYDLLILADLLFNHSQHSALLASVQSTLKKSFASRALVFFTPYRPWLLKKDMAFMDLANEMGFTVDKILEEVLENVMFEEDPGDDLLRRTVFGYELKWAREVLNE